MNLEVSNSESIIQPHLDLHAHKAIIAMVATSFACSLLPFNYDQIFAEIPIEGIYVWLMSLISLLT